MNCPLRIALIPSYEPTHTLIDLLLSARQAGFVTIVVNDGSGQNFDGIFNTVSEKSTVLTHNENLGKGRALKTGFKYILSAFGNCCTVVTMDSDGQHSINDAIKVCEESERTPDSLILGSRALKDNVPLRSRMGNGITREVYKLSTGVDIHDTQTGLRAFQGGLLGKMLEIAGERYEYEMNVLLDFAKEKIPIKETEISTLYFDKNSGSHFHTVRDSYLIYREILKFSASSFLSFLLDYGLYTLLSLLTSSLGTIGLTISNVGARIVSAGVNYTLNRNLVFKSKTGVLKSAMQYFLLAALILAGNTAVLNVLSSYLGMNRYLAKLLTELLFFFISYISQHNIIFHEKTENPQRRKI